MKEEGGGSDRSKKVIMASPVQTKIKAVDETLKSYWMEKCLCISHFRLMKIILNQGMTTYTNCIPVSMIALQDANLYLIHSLVWMYLFCITYLYKNKLIYKNS